MSGGWEPGPKCCWALSMAAEVLHVISSKSDPLRAFVNAVCWNAATYDRDWLAKPSVFTLCPFVGNVC